MKLNTKRLLVLKSILLTAFGVAIAISWAFCGSVASCVAQSIISEDGRYQLSADGKKFGLYLEHDSALAEFVVPDGVETIMPGAFREVRKLKRIVLPASVVEIGKDAFVCPDLDAIDVAEENPVFRSINGVLFSKDGKTLVRLPMGRQTDCYYVPKGVETIESGALQYCFFLKTVVIPNCVKTIGDNAISGGFLATISLPTSVEHIGDGAFENYTHVKSVYVAEDNPFFRSIDGVLYSKDGKTLLFYPRGKEGGEREAPETAERSKEDVQFSDDGKTLIKYPETKADEVFYVPDGVETIASEAFMNCASIRSIVIPEGVTAIGDKAFYGCRKLETIALPSSLKSLGEQTIYENDSLTGIYVDYNPVFSSIGGVLCSKDGKTLIKCPEALRNIEHYSVPKGVERIEKYAFANCRQLSGLGLSEETKEIDPEAFVGCLSLRSISPGQGNQFFLSDHALFSKDRTVLVKYPPALKQVNYDVPKGVKEIVDDAFDGCSQLETIKLPETLEKIGARAFAGCSRLKTLTIPENVSSISDDAFNSTSSVRAHKGSYAERYAKEKNIKFETISEEEEIASTFRLSADGKILYEYIGKGKKATIPNGVEAVGGFTFDLRASGNDPRGDFSMLKTIVIPKSVKQIKGGFQSCYSLESIEVAEDNPSYRSIDGVLCSKDGKTLLWAPSSPKKEPFVVPDGVEVIGSRAFEGHGRIKSVVLPDSVKIIDDGAFMFCDSLESVELSKNLETIGRDAFYFCRSLKKIVLPKSVKTIRDGAFSHCSSLETCDVPETVEELGNGVFTGCSSLKSFNIPEDNPTFNVIDGFLCSKDGTMLLGASEVGETCLIPDGIVRIGPGAFSGCNATSIVFPDTVKEIGVEAFVGCSLLSRIELSKNLEKIGDRAFASCSSLKTINIPDSCQEIGFAAFNGCAALSSFVVPKGVKKIGDFTFSGCSALTELIVPKGVEQFGREAFRGCSSLKKVVLPEGFKEIGSGAFHECLSLEEVVFPESVEVVEGGAFHSCKSLKTFVWPQSVKEIASFTFVNCSSLENVVLPDNLEKLGDRVFLQCASLKSIVVPKGVKKIEEFAFAECPSLKTVTLLGNVESIDPKAFWQSRFLTIRAPKESCAEAFVKEFNEEISKTIVASYVKERSVNFEPLD
ncbi:MAG: leucine-rich repeat domain-containing protein [Thermoguttaceae bacterium]|nr:leucine-rich repeat domain-containing protein [Thermoguttaceae bacterium]